MIFSQINKMNMTRPLGIFDTLLILSGFAILDLSGEWSLTW